MRHLIARSLAGRGFGVTGARDGREMWATPDNAPADLVLLDAIPPAGPLEDARQPSALVRGR